MKKQFITIAILSSLLAGTSFNVHAIENSPNNIKQQQYVGAGIGAVTGALIAGPVGFIAGGLIGSLAGKHDAMNNITSEQLTDTGQHYTDASEPAVSTPSNENETTGSVIVAQANEIENVLDDEVINHTSILEDILVEDLSLDVFFLSGSISVEAFYKPQMQALAKIMQVMPNTDIHLEGYSDRRGNKDSNLALSNERIDAVRNELVQAGVEAKRIHSHAYGEHKFISSPGDLDAYNFDRRVVIRFQNAMPVSKSPVASIEDASSI